MYETADRPSLVCPRNFLALSLCVLLHRSVDRPVGVSLCDAVALVVVFLSLAEPDRHLDSRALEIERQRNEGISLS